MIERHSHSGLGGDGEKIDYNNLINKPSKTYFLEKDNRWDSGYAVGAYKVTTGFKPSLIKIEAIVANASQDSWSIGECSISSSGDLTQVVTYYSGYLNKMLMDINYVIYIQPYASINRAHIGTIYDDGFDLVFDDNNYSLDVKIIAYP